MTLPKLKAKYALLMPSVKMLMTDTNTAVQIYFNSTAEMDVIFWGVN